MEPESILTYILTTEFFSPIEIMLKRLQCACGFMHGEEENELFVNNFFKAVSDMGEKYDWDLNKATTEESIMFLRSQILSSVKGPERERFEVSMEREDFPGNWPSEKERDPDLHS